MLSRNWFGRALAGVRVISTLGPLVGLVSALFVSCVGRERARTMAIDVKIKPKHITMAATAANDLDAMICNLVTVAFRKASISLFTCRSLAEH